MHNGDRSQKRWEKIKAMTPEELKEEILSCWSYIETLETEIDAVMECLPKYAAFPADVIDKLKDNKNVQ